jgi:hypothetical protein
MDGQAGIEQNLNVIKAGPEGGVKIRPVTPEGLLGRQSPEVNAAGRLEQQAAQGKNPHDVLREFVEEGKKKPQSIGELVGQFRENGDMGKLLEDYQEMNDLPAINLHQDQTFLGLVDQSITRWEEQNQEPHKGKQNLSESERYQWMEWAARKDEFRNHGAIEQAKRDFQRENPELFQKYQRFGIYTENGIPRLASDPIWRNFEQQANARTTRLAQTGASYEAASKVARREALQNFAYSYPEKAEIYGLTDPELAEVLQERAKKKAKEQAAHLEKNKSQPTKQIEEQNNEGQPPQQSGETQREQPPAEPVSAEEKKKGEGEDNESLKVTTDALSEYLFGIKPDSEENLRKILERLKEDKAIVRAKYGFPPEEMLRSDPSEYERRLRETAQRLGVTILPKIGCGSFFEENFSAGAVYIDARETGGSSKIGVDIKREEIKGYIKSLSELEHELIHALQAKRYPRIPIELLEYEAYVAGANIDFLEKDLEAIRDVFLGFFLGGSINIDYRLMNQERVLRGLPPVIPESLKKYIQAQEK